MHKRFPPSTWHDADAEILKAHESGDMESLVKHYTKIADEAELCGDIDACCYFLTLAYVFALDAGHDDHPILQSRLHAHGRI